MPAKKAQVQDLASLTAEVNKKFGVGTLMMASESVSARIVRVPSGIRSLDYVMGGGFPVGRFIGISGSEMSGKSAVCHMATAEFQKHCRKCYRKLTVCSASSDDCPSEPCKVLWLDAEGTYDAAWAEKLGVDNSQIHLIRPDSTENGIDVAEAMVRTGEIDFIVIDSVSALAPMVEQEASAHDHQMGIQAKALNKAWRVIGAANNARGQLSHGVTILLINQHREKLSGFGGKVIPGGLGQRFAWSIHLELRTESWAVREEGSGTSLTKERVGQWVVFTAVKNKTASPHGLGRFLLMVADDEETGLKIGQVDHFSQLLDYGVSFGIVEKTGAWYNMDGFKGQGEQGFRKKLIEDPAKLEELTLAVDAKMKARHAGDGAIPLNLPQKRKP